MRKIQLLPLLSAIVLFAIAPATTAHAQTVSVLYDFGAVSGDPLFPYWEGIIGQGRDGNLYTTTMDGGTNGFGAAFRVSPTGKLHVLDSFTSADSTPESGLVLASDGNLYGTTQLGGTGAGQVFNVSTTGTLTVLYTFTGGPDGEFPFAPPSQGPDGNFYGTTASGGGHNFGTVYKMTSSGTLTTLHSFAGTDGANPHAPLALGTDGNFYGTAWAGGSSNDGVVFKITPSGSYKVLYNFDGTHGANPNGLLVQGSDGNFYGTTENGGANNAGAIFKMSAAGTLKVLYSLNGTSDGSQPLAGLVQATDGNFYGTASAGGSSACTGGCGTMFKITSSGTYSVIYTFDSTTGASPAVTMFQHTNGMLYGDTENGGTGCASPGCGVFFDVNLNLKPFTSLVFTSGKVGTSVQFLAHGFNNATAVSFNGTPATSFQVVSDTYMTATVPSGATTGFVTITIPGGSLTTNKKFQVTPQILSFSPPSGPVGTSVVITGVSLTQTSLVTFGGVKATTFTVNSDTQVTATVPTGAVTGRIAITTPGGSATSATNFTVTP